MTLLNLMSTPRLEEFKDILPTVTSTIGVAVLFILIVEEVVSIHQLDNDDQRYDR